MNREIADMREDYTRHELTRDQLDSSPMTQFEIWFDHATKSQIKEPNAMILSTVDSTGRPSARTVLLKELEAKGFVFYTNYNSDKAKDIADNPKVAITFLWKELERQVRIQGKAVKVSHAKSLAYYHKRPKGSQIGAWVSPQSAVIADRSILERRQAELNDQYKDVDKLPLPENWGGFIIKPQIIEFWQGRSSRLHDRFRYTLESEQWKIDRLAP